MKYVVCDRCGSHLDYGETCDCEKADEEDACTVEAVKKTERSYSDHERQIRRIAG